MVSRLGTGVRAGIVSILVVVLGAGPASALFITTTTEPDVLPDGGGDVTLTITANCEPRDIGCTVITLNDDTYGAIDPSDCREQGVGDSIFGVMDIGDSRTCTVTRPLAAEGPATITNTTSGTYLKLDTSHEIVPFEPVESTVTILGPCERDETEPDECNEDPRDEDELTEEEPGDVDDADDEDDEEDDEGRGEGSRAVERDESGEDVSDEGDDSEDEDD